MLLIVAPFHWAKAFTDTAILCSALAALPINLPSATLDIRMPSPLPFVLTLCVVLVCVWLWWRNNKH
jgi:hypothetical protein